MSALHDTLHNEVLNKGYIAEFSTIEQIFEASQMIEDASQYHIRMRRMGNAGLTARTTRATWSKLEQVSGTSKPTATTKSSTTANIAAHMPPSKPYNNYKADQKLVQPSRSSS